MSDGIADHPYGRFFYIGAFMCTLMQKDSLLNGISQTLGLIVIQTGGRNEDSKILAGLRNRLYGLAPEKIDYEAVAKLVKEKFEIYKL